MSTDRLTQICSPLHPQEGCSLHPPWFCCSWLGAVLVGRVTVPTPHWDPTPQREGFSCTGQNWDMLGTQHQPGPPKGSERSSNTHQGIQRTHRLPSTSSALAVAPVSPGTSQSNPRTQHIQNHPWTQEHTESRAFPLEPHSYLQEKQAVL